jgi:2-C-methyl-D-erythritol 4-phosphate cytidylyltransferase
MICALIVAGGSGIRMNAPTKKQYLVLDDRPILAHTLSAFGQHTAVEKLILVVPKADAAYCRKEIVAGMAPNRDVEIVEGGGRRQESVYNGLCALNCEEGVVMIHDGVRPFVRPWLIDACLSGVRKTGACIPVVPATDTIKRIDENNIILDTLQRERIRLAQTPQTFSISLIKKAHQLAAKSNFTATDDASIAEFAGERVMVIPGDPENIKITRPHDLLFAREILGRLRNSPAR